GQVGHYIALSHRWGGKLSLKTTKCTLSRRFNGFCIDNLSRTFRDAVCVAKALGIEYIWIDSLCIVQDDRGDWLEQSTKMGSIYMNSAFNIAAHSAGQFNEGFLWRSQVSPALCISPKHGGPPFLVSIPYVEADQLYGRFTRSEISHRAWILQELTLSPRILHFVEDRLFWECRHRVPEIDGKTPEITAAMFRGAGGGLAVHTMWLKPVSRYTDYQMTKTGDKLVALSGIVDVWWRTMQRLGDSDYHCGVFQEDMERSLLWYSSGKAERHLERALS
ncbi:heterokaryon incompatibility protein-domain-containing protein, partial [Podospora didyma]